MAIARNSSADLGLQNPGNPYTASYTCGSGANRLLVVSSFHASTDVITGATYNGVAMTLVGKIQNPGDRWLYMFYLLAPASGANNVVINDSAGGVLGHAYAEDYTGVLQSGQPDASGTNSASSATVSKAITVVAANCWIVAGLREDAGVATVWTGAASLQANGGGHSADSNATVATGSVTTTAVSAGAGNSALIVASFAPDTGGGATTWGPWIAGTGLNWNRIVSP